jgi:hypothetical protein
MTYAILNENIVNDDDGSGRHSEKRVWIGNRLDITNSTGTFLSRGGLVIPIH